MLTIENPRWTHHEQGRYRQHSVLTMTFLVFMYLMKDIFLIEVVQHRFLINLTTSLDIICILMIWITRGFIWREDCSNGCSCIIIVIIMHNRILLLVQLLLSCYLFIWILIFLIIRLIFKLFPFRWWWWIFFSITLLYIRCIVIMKTLCSKLLSLFICLYILLIFKRYDLYYSPVDFTCLTSNTTHISSLYILLIYKLQ